MTCHLGLGGAASRRCNLARGTVHFDLPGFKNPTKEEYDVCLNITDHKDCGTHFAETCSRCPLDPNDESINLGAARCKGQCVWEGSECRDKKAGDVDCAYYGNEQSQDRNGFFRPTCADCNDASSSPNPSCNGQCQLRNGVCEQVSTRYVRKYTNRWPNCGGPQLGCPKASRAEFETMCTENENCSGFSYSDAAGWGCLKDCRNNARGEAFRGYATGAHDYWEKIVEG